MKRFLLKTAAAVPVALLLFSQPAQATTQTGQIALTAQTKDGTPLAGVPFALDGEEYIGGPLKVESDENGFYRFTQLPPGVYEVTATHPDYERVRVDGILVRIGHTTTISIELVPAAEAAGVEVIEVTGQVPVVDTERLALGFSINDTFVENVPTNRTYQGMAQLVPGVVGGGNPNVHGSSLYGNQYLLDGINVTDPVSNTFSANFNFDAIKSVEIITGGRDAEYGTATGGVVNIVTKGGSNEFHADASAYFDSSETQVKGPDEEDLDNQSLSVNLNLGGPIIKDKLWYYVSAEVPWTQFTAPDPEGGVIFPDREGKKHPSRNFIGAYGLGKLTWRASPDQLFKLMFQADPAWISNTRQDPAVHPDAEREQIQTGFVLALISETFLSAELFWSNRLAFSQNRLQIHPQSGDTDTPSHSNLELGTYTVNDSRWLDDKRYRVQFHSALTYNLDDLLGEHQLKLGVDASLVFNKVFESRPGGRSFRDNGLDANDPNQSITGAGVPWRMDLVGDAQDTTIFGDTEAVYLQDVWKPFTSLTIRPGLRFDSSRMRDHEGKVQVHVNTLSPRIGIGWDPFDDEKTVLRAGYYQYVDTGYLALSDFVGKTMLVRTYEYNQQTEQYDTFLYESGGASGNQAKDYLKKPFNQRRPRTHEVIVGLSRELVSDAEFSADFTYRYNANQWEDDEGNLLWNQDSSGVIGFRNGEKRYIYRLGAMPDAFIRYWGIEFVINKRMSRNWEMLASYTYSRTQGSTPYMLSVAFDRARVRELEYGNLPQDIRHVFKIHGSYKLPFGFVVGGMLLYRSGAPYNRYYQDSFFGGYNTLQAPRGHDVTEDGDYRELRLPDRFRLDTRVVWHAEELVGLNVDLIFQIQNLFNSRETTEVEQRNLPAGGATQWGDETDKMDPFIAQIGLRFRY